MDQIPNIPGTAVFSEEAVHQQKRLKKFMPIALQARTKVLSILQFDANKVVEDVEKSVIPSLMTELLRDCADVILSADVKDIVIYENGSIGIGGISFGKIWQYRNLTPHQSMVLQALSLSESLKTLPYKNPEELLIDMPPDLKEKLKKEDEENVSDWMKKKERLEAILQELESMNISENGTVMPEYLREVK